MSSVRGSDEAGVVESAGRRRRLERASERVPGGRHGPGAGRRDGTGGEP